MKRTLYLIRISAVFLLISTSIIAQNINTIAGNGTQGYTGDSGPDTAARMYFPNDVATDSAGNIYIADTWNDVIRKVDHATGIITTVAGVGSSGYSGDNGPATSAALNYPYGIVLNRAGDLYISDSYNYRVRKVDHATGTITTVAGNGTAGYSGDGAAATAAEITNPIGLAVDAAGNLYIADASNNCVRKVDGAGIITTLAGNGTPGYSGDGALAINATFNNVYDVAVDLSGDLYIADQNNHVVRKVDHATGKVSTVAGSAGYGFSGDGGAATSATLTAIKSVCLDAVGNIYISDSSMRIRAVDHNNGFIYTIAGTGVQGYAGDGGPATVAEFSAQRGICVSPNGDLYVADQTNNRVRSVSLTGALGISAVSVDRLMSLYPNPSNDIVNVTVGTAGSLTYTIYDVAGRIIDRADVDTNDHDALQLSVAAYAPGIYTLCVHSQQGVKTAKFIKE